MKKYFFDSSEKIRAGGSEYYLRFRSQKLSNPLVLFLHGGCGTADRPFVMKWQSPLADFCTLVAWDQRGAGMAYNRKDAKNEVLTKELYLDDLHNVVQYLKRRFRKDKIILAGHSFGTQLGVWYAEKYPEDLECYVGIGQVVDTVRNERLSYDFTLEEAIKKKDRTAVKALRKIGPPQDGVYKGSGMLIQKNYMNKFGGSRYGKHGNSVVNTIPMIPCMLREYSPKTMANYLIANSYCLSQPIGKEKVDFIRDVKELKVPVYMFMGKSDRNTVYSLAAEWFEQLRAPYKKFYAFEKSAHAPQWEEPDKWNKIFKEEILGIL